MVHQFMLILLLLLFFLISTDASHAGFCFQCMIAGCRLPRTMLSKRPRHHSCFTDCRPFVCPLLLMFLLVELTPDSQHV